jgi:hydrogenase maturation protease
MKRGEIEHDLIWLPLPGIATSELPVQGPNILVIGYGNALRRDDGAGPALAVEVAAYLSRKGIQVRLISASQLVPEMAIVIAEEEPAIVLFVDTFMDTFVDRAAREPSSGIQIMPIGPETASPTLGHQLGPAMVLTIAALLYESHPRAWLVTIPGVDFAHGEGFSEGVEKLLQDVPVLGDRLIQMIQASQEIKEAKEMNHA